MARKDCSKCGDATCNCAIIEGPGTNVTGIGSGASPYIVEADIVHVDTPTVTLTGNGGSTPLSAVVNLCGLTDNLNEVSSGSLLVKGVDPDCLAVLDPGVAGQAVVSNGTGFVLGTPTQTPITPVDTPSVNLTVSGVDDHTLQADVVISPDAGNTLVENANGLFAAGGAITVADTNCIDLEGVGTVADPLTATPIIDPLGNIECSPDGLRVTPSLNIGEVLTTSATGVVTWEPGATSVVTPVVPVAPLTARTIATHDDGNGVVSNIQETITTLARVDDCTLRYTNEAGTQTDFDNNIVKTTILPAGIRSTLQFPAAAGASDTKIVRPGGTYTNNECTDMVAVVRAMLTTSAENTEAINSGLTTVAYGIRTNIANANGATQFSAGTQYGTVPGGASFRGSTGTVTFTVIVPIGGTFNWEYIFGGTSTNAGTLFTVINDATIELRPV